MLAIGAGRSPRADERCVDEVRAEEPDLRLILRTTSLTSRSLVPSSPIAVALRAAARAWMRMCSWASWARQSAALVPSPP